MKIFEIIVANGETEFIASKNNIKAIIFYQKLTGADESDFNDEDYIQELPKRFWKHMKIKNDEYNSELPEDDKNWDTKTFDEYMKDVTETELIATTNN